MSNVDGGWEEVRRSFVYTRNPSDGRTTERSDGCELGNRVRFRAEIPIRYCHCTHRVWKQPILLCNACPLFFSTGGKCRRGLNLTTNIYPVRRLQMRQIPSYTCPLVCTYAQRLIIIVQSSDAQIPGDYILWALSVDLASCDPFSA